MCTSVSRQLLRFRHGEVRVAVKREQNPQHNITESKVRKVWLAFALINEKKKIPTALSENRVEKQLAEAEKKYT